MAWLYALIIFVSIMLDQFSKHWAITTLHVGQSINIIPNFLSFTVIGNNGAAWSMLSGQTLFFYIVTTIAIIVLLIAFYKMRHDGKVAMLSLSFLLAGTIGNAIDRFAHGYVIDMIHINVFNLPLLNFVCNLADIYITIGVVLLLIYIVKSDKKEGQN